MKRTIKNALYLFAMLLVGPLALFELGLRRLAKRDVWFQFHSELLSLFPGKSGQFLRNAYYHFTLRRCPLHCCFLTGVMFTHSEAEVGERVYIGAHSILGMVTIGNDALLADHV